MSIVQKNAYSPGRDLSNLSINVDANRVTDDKSFITINFGTTPATVTVKQGSLIEANGNLYTIESSDEIFQMAAAGHNFITFDGTTFTSQATIGIYNPLKGGYYTGTARVLGWYIDQTDDIFYRYKLVSDVKEVGQRDMAYTSDGDITAIGDLISTGLLTDNVSYRTRIEDIGVWDMSAATGVGTIDVTISPTITANLIRSVTGVLIDDAGTVIYPISVGSGWTNVTTPDGEVWIELVTSALVRLKRQLTGFFDSAQFNGGSNRGWITIHYI